MMKLSFEKTCLLIVLCGSFFACSEMTPFPDGDWLIDKEGVIEIGYESSLYEVAVLKTIVTLENGTSHEMHLCTESISPQLKIVGTEIIFSGKRLPINPHIRNICSPFEFTAVQPIDKINE